jgi:CRP-like cAMP-binding protein
LHGATRKRSADAVVDDLCHYEGSASEPKIHGSSAAEAQMYGSSSLRRQLLRRSGLFARLGDADLDALLAHSTVARFAEGEQIFAKGDPGNSMMAVLKGEVTITAPSSDGRQVVLTTMGEGDVFGEIALIDGKERTADATAAKACELLVVARRSLLSMLERRPDLCVDLLTVVCERLRRTNEQVEDLAFLDLEARLAKVLLRLAGESEGTLPPTHPVGIKVSQRILGELAGGSRESVNKHLQDWKRAGIIAVERGAIMVLQPAALAALT